MLPCVMMKENGRTNYFQQCKLYLWKDSSSKATTKSEMLLGGKSAQPRLHALTCDVHSSDKSPMKLNAVDFCNVLIDAMDRSYGGWRYTYIG